MKKQILLSIIFLVFICNSCKKDPNYGGIWSFKSGDYYVVSCFELDGANGVQLYIAADRPSDGSIAGQNWIPIYPGEALVICEFGLPAMQGTYAVIPINTSFDSTKSQVKILAGFGSSSNATYISTGGNGNNQTVAVTVSNGKISVSGSGIEMINSAAPFDSSALTLNIHQLQ